MLKDMLNGTVDKIVSGASVARPVVPRFSSQWHQRKLKVVVCFHLLHPRRYASDEQPLRIRSADEVAITKVRRRTSIHSLSELGDCQCFFLCKTIS
jgi:hypothetical protein